MRINIDANKNNKLISISCEEISSDSRFYVKNIFGKNLHKGEFISNSITYDMSSFPQGPYFIEIEDRKESVLKKIEI